MELVGEFEGSGFKTTPYLVRRPDGQVLQLTQLLYLVAEQADGQKDDGEIAHAVTQELGKTVSADNVRFLLEEKLRPLGILEDPDGTAPRVAKADPLLALKLKKVLVSERGVRVLARIFRPLFWPPVMIAVVSGFVALDVWFFGIHGVAQSIRTTLHQPAVMILLYGLLVLSVMWHEVGHATACAYGGGKPGVIGFGIYIVWPAFYCDVTDAYRLGKGSRVRADIGGVYFNVIFSLGLGAAYWFTGFEPLLALLLIQHLLMIYQFIPFLRLDGYYVVSDLTGIPDLFSRIKPTLVSLVPWKKAHPKATEMKPWVRGVVTAWVLLTVPFLTYAFATMVFTAPRVIATAHSSLLKHWGEVSSALDRGRSAQAAAGSFQMGLLVLPLAGMGVTFSRVGIRLGKGSVRFARQRPGAASALAGISAVVIGILALRLPPPEYRPITPQERGTVQSSVRAATDVVQRPLAPEPALESPGASPSPEPESSPGAEPSPSPTSTDRSEPSPTPSGRGEGTPDPTPEASP